MILLRHPYREFQKNPLLGEGIVLFMSTPGTPSTPGAPGAEEEIFEAPSGQQVPAAKPLTKAELAAQLGTPKGTPPKTIEPTLKDGAGFDKGVEKAFYQKMKNAVTDTPELKMHGEFEAHWISKLGDYNGVQGQIDRLVEQKKRFSDDRFIKDTPDFKSEYKKAYQEMSQSAKILAEQGHFKVSPATQRIINEQAGEKALDNAKIKGEAEALKRSDIIRAIDDLTAKLLEERKRQFLELMEYMLDNLKRRVIALLKKWQENPPVGYEDVQEEWILYCVELLEALDKTDFKDLDMSKPDFPEMNEHFALAKDWWYSVSLFEDSYKDFQEGGKEEISKESLSAQFADLEKKAEERLSDAKVHEYQEKLDAVTSKIDEVAVLMDAKLKDKSLNALERDQYKSEIFGLKKNKEELLKKRDLKKIVNDTLYSEEVLTTFQRSGQSVDIKKGLKHQLEFFDKAPLDTQERRLLLRSMNDEMKEMKLAFDNIDIEANVKLVDSLEKLKQYQTNLGQLEGPMTHEVIWINPIEAWGHVWHSVTTTIKGNMETEAKRGAGYLQKQGTKWMANVPNPTNNQVLKSFKEFSANGQQEAEHAEHGRVGDIQKGYEGFNTEHLLHIASETDDRWEFKACLNLLADRGRINWYDGWIYKQLNRWQKTIKIPEDPNYHRTYITTSDDMLRQAFVYIYRVTDDFKNIKNKNNGSWESKKGEFQKGLGLLAAEPGGLKKEADKLLGKFEEDHKNHIHFSQADPIKYEAIICYAIEQGKMMGEDRMYYINKGIASGFLPFDRGAELTKLNNTYPPVDRYDAPTARGDRPSIVDIQEWACNDKVTNIYDVFETLSDNAAANQRANKTISQGQNRVDHDDAPMLAGHIDAETMQGILSRNGQGGYGLPATGLQSLVVGHELWMDMYAHRYKDKPKEFNDAQLSRFVTMFMRFDGVTSRQMFENQNTFWRLPSSADDDAPRCGGSYTNLFGHETLRDKQGKKNSVRGYIDSVKGYLELLDFDPEIALIKKLNNKEFKTTEEVKSFIGRFKKKCGDKAGDEIFASVEGQTTKIEMINKLYEVAIPAYINYITKTPQHAVRVKLMVDAINADHKKVWDAQDAARKATEKAGNIPGDSEISLTHRLQQVAAKQNAIRQAAYGSAQGKPPDPHGAHHGSDHEEEGDGGGAAHHRKGFSDEEDNESESRWKFSRRDHRNRASRSTFR